MTSPRRFESDLPALLADLYLAGTPNYRDDVVRQIAGVPQRPAWTFPGRWLPMELVTTRVPTTRLPMRQLGVLALIAILVAAALAAYIGSHQVRVPPAFGPAGNGVIAFVTPAGDVAIADPDAGRSEVLVTAPQQLRAPSFSLDGTRVAYERLDADGIKVMVIDLEHRRPIQIAVVPNPTDLLQWSPDGTRLAFISGGLVWIANTDGSGFESLDFGVKVGYEIDWRPPDGAELVVRGERDNKAGLFLVRPDGSPPRPITPLDGTEFEYVWVSWSPDGSRLAYSDFPAKEVHILDVSSQTDTMIDADTGVGLMFPRWSPDGSRLSVMTWLSETPQTVQIGVLPVGDPARHLTLTGPTFSNGIQHDWSPDGTVIFATEWGTSSPWLLDPAGGPGKRPAWTATFPDWVEWQRVAR